MRIILISQILIMKNYCFILILSAFFTACEGYREANGIVLDADTLEPLDSVLVGSWVSKIKKNNFESEMLTDSTGVWWASTGLVGCDPRGCADLWVRFSRSGYDTLQVENPQDSVVLLKKK